MFQLIPENGTHYTTTILQKCQVTFFKTKTKFFKNYFFLAVTMEWNNLDVDWSNSAS